MIRSHKDKRCRFFGTWLALSSLCYSRPSVVEGFSSISSPTPYISYRDRIKYSTTRSFAASKENTDTDNKRDKLNDENVLLSTAAEDLPSWVQAIRKWPGRPPPKIDKENDTSRKVKKDVKNGGRDEKTSGLIKTSGGGWLMDPIIRSLVNVQDILGSTRNETVQGTASNSRDFLDFLGDDSTSSSQNPTLAQMEAILDSLQDSAIVVNVSRTSPNDMMIDEEDTGWNRWDRWIGGMQQALGGTSTKNLTAAAEGILRQATMRIESLLSEASVPASSTLQAVLDVIPANATALAAQIAAERSLDINEAMERAAELGSFAGQLKGVADGLLRQGYVSEQIKEVEIISSEQATTVNATGTVKLKKKATKQAGALFDDFASASEISTYSPILGQAGEMAAMAGAIYEQTTVRSLQLGHSIVAKGCSKNVKWLVTDSLASHSEIELCNDRVDNDPSEAPILIRTITIRGFDASDEEVDRETLLTRIITANPKRLSKYKVDVHNGLWEIANAVYNDIIMYIDWTTPQHKIVLNGHSIGGSVANLILFILTMERGPDFVRDRILRVFSFGSPPVARVSKQRDNSRRQSSPLPLYCDVLDAFGLPTDMVWSFVQPWDPISRLFSEIDALYPLIGDMGPGSDGITPWPKGPPRTLRPVTKAILEAWEGWPRFRDSYYETGSQQYAAVGIQHILLPEATRYLTDRFLTVSIAVPPVRSLLRISSHEIYPALTSAFPLDVFEVSYVPQAIRSFVHHFYPAYGFPLVEYIRLLEEQAEPLLVRDNLASVPKWEEEELKTKTEAVRGWGLAGQWLQQQSRETNSTVEAR